jgi:hypothetical protein
MRFPGGRGGSWIRCWRDWTLVRARRRDQRSRPGSSRRHSVSRLVLIEPSRSYKRFSLISYRTYHPLTSPDAAAGSITPIAVQPPRIPTESLVNVNPNGITPAIQFDPFLLQPFAQESGMTVDGALLNDNTAFFNWEGFLSEMYCNDPIFP